MSIIYLQVALLDKIRHFFIFIIQYVRGGGVILFSFNVTKLFILVEGRWVYMKKSFFFKNRSKTFNVKSYEDSDKKAKIKRRSSKKIDDKITEKVKIFDKNQKNKNIVKNGQNIVVKKKTGNTQILVKNINKLDKFKNKKIDLYKLVKNTNRLDELEKPDNKKDSDYSHNIGKQSNFSLKEDLRHTKNRNLTKENIDSFETEGQKKVTYKPENIVNVEFKSKENNNVENNNNNQIPKSDQKSDNVESIVDKTELKKQIDNSINFINSDFCSKLGSKTDGVKFKTHKPNSNNLVKDFNKYVKELYALRGELNEIHKSGRDILSIKRHLGYYNNLCKYINEKQEEEIDTTNQSREQSIKNIQDFYHKFTYELLLPHEKADEKGRFSLKFVEDAKTKEKKIKKSMKHYMNELEKLEFQVSKLKENVNANKAYTSLDFNIESIVRNIGNRLGTVSQCIDKIWKSSWPASHFKKQIDEAQNTLTGEKNSVEFLFNQIDDIKTSVKKNSEKLEKDKSKLNMIDKDELEDLKKSLDEFTEFCRKTAKDRIDIIKSRKGNIENFISSDLQPIFSHDSGLGFNIDLSGDKYGRKPASKREIKKNIKEKQEILNNTEKIYDKIEELGINKNFKKSLINLYQIILTGELFKASVDSFAKGDTIFVKRSRTAAIFAETFLFIGAALDGIALGFLIGVICLL